MNVHVNSYNEELVEYVIKDGRTIVADRIREYHITETQATHFQLQFVDNTQPVIDTNKDDFRTKCCGKIDELQEFVL